MTKTEIKDQLLILKESLKGNAKNHFAISDEPNDYDFGYAEACERYAERIETLYNKIDIR